MMNSVIFQRTSVCVCVGGGAVGVTFLFSIFLFLFCSAGLMKQKFLLPNLDNI
jgi:hypothetical protein